MFRHFFLVLLVCLETAYCRQVVDLSHTLDENTPKWPIKGFGGVTANFTYFKRENLYSQFYKDRMWLAFGSIEFYEHMGTHMDAPSHFAKGRQPLDQIPVDKLMGPGVVINVRAQAMANPVYAVSLDDIHKYEDKYGRIQPKSIVMMNSGWADKYPNSKLMFGTDDILNSSSFHFPGFSLEACVMLLQERQVSVVGVDTSSVDVGPSRDYPCHVYLQTNNVPLLEYIANLDSIPANGTTIMLGAMKVRGATGAPVRILAFIDEDKDIANAAVDNASWFLVAVIPSWLFAMTM